MENILEFKINLASKFSLKKMDKTIKNSLNKPLVDGEKKGENGKIRTQNSPHYEEGNEKNTRLLKLFYLLTDIFPKV